MIWEGIMLNIQIEMKYGGVRCNKWKDNPVAGSRFFLSFETRVVDRGLTQTDSRSFTTSI